MASTRQDALAKRLAERIQHAPSKGRVAKAPSAAPSRPAQRAEPDPKPDPKPAPSRASKPAKRRSKPSQRSTETPAAAPPTRTRRGAAGTALRGHLVPDALHGQARRRKIELRAQRGARVTWDDVMQEGVALLVAKPKAARKVLRHLDGSTDDTRRRLVQATLPAELDQSFVELQLDLSDRDGGAATYEQLWTTAVTLWLRSTT
jgi:hypothetical protein